MCQRALGITSLPFNLKLVAVSGRVLVVKEALCVLV